MHWQFKALLDGAKALLPFQGSLRAAKRRFFPYRPEADINGDTLADGLEQIRWLRHAGIRLSGATVLELGTGWQPIIPALYYVAGCERIYLTDTEVLTDEALVLQTADLLCGNAERIGAALDVPAAFVRRALAIQPTGRLAGTLEQLRMTYLAPWDTSRLPIPEASVDLVFSRAVLEHVPPGLMVSIFHEARRILKPSGAMLHFIDNSDHWEHRDKRISRVNFLRYPEWLFRLTCINPQNYQNRLRHSDYVAMLSRCGFRVIRQEGLIDANALQSLRALPLARPFRGSSMEDLAAVTSRILASCGPLVEPEEFTLCNENQQNLAEA
jgi:SAM-dependent methyltransferase